MPYYIIEKQEAIDAIEDWGAAYKAQRKKFKEVMNQIEGAVAGTLTENGLQSVVFGKGHEVEQKTWKKTRTGWAPKLNSAKGKALSKLLRSVPGIRKESLAIYKAVDFPNMLSTNDGTSTVCFGPGISKLKETGQYVAHVDEKYMHQYIPPPYFKEITHTEYKEKGGNQ